jgi:GNAT superfamily N-acetyltransferase
MQALDRNIVIEHAYPRDMDSILELWTELMRLTELFHHRYVLAPGALAIQHKYLRGFFDTSGAVIYVARAGADVVGFVNAYVTKPAQVFRQDSIGIIENIFVCDEYRRMGIARTFVERCVTFLDNQRVADIYVNVIPSNVESERFWLAMGFETSKVTMALPRR